MNKINTKCISACSAVRTGYRKQLLRFYDSCAKRGRNLRQREMYPERYRDTIAIEHFSGMFDRLMRKQKKKGQLSEKHMMQLAQIHSIICGLAAQKDDSPYLVHLKAQLLLDKMTEQSEHCAAVHQFSEMLNQILLGADNNPELSKQLLEMF